MSLFDWLLVSHLVGDFLLQTDRMARGKAQAWRPMVAHIACYMAVVAIPLLAYSWRNSLSPWPAVAAFLLIAGTHIVLDRRDFTAWWMRFAGISQNHTWLAIVVDQVFHVVVLALATQVVLFLGHSGSA